MRRQAGSSDLCQIRRDNKHKCTHIHSAWGGGGTPEALHKSGNQEKVGGAQITDSAILQFRRASLAPAATPLAHRSGLETLPHLIVKLRNRFLFFYFSVPFSHANDKYFTAMKTQKMSELGAPYSKNKIFILALFATSVIRAKIGRRKTIIYNSPGNEI